MKLPTLTDPTAPPPARVLDAWSDRLCLPFLVDDRDVVFTRLVTRVVTQLLPLSIGMFLLPGTWVAVLAVPYLVYLFARFGGPTVLALHAVTHRPLFRKRHRRWDRLVTHLLPLFFGFPPFAYRSHHVLMHHKMENGRDDLSSTAAYRRDSPLHFLHYWARFTFFGYFHLITWLLRRGRSEVLWALVLGDLATHAVMLGLLYVNPPAALVVCWIPYLLLRFFLMAGNWSEHAFVDAENPSDPFRNSTNLLNTPYNHRSYNAGYHLVHHLVPGLHWADTPQYFRKHLPRLVDRDTIVFDGIRNNQEIWWCLMRGDYGHLADHLLDLGDRRPTREEKIGFLRDRVRGRAGDVKGLVTRTELAPT
jgi:fatty acid desaturase